MPAAASTRVIMRIADVQLTFPAILTALLIDGVALAIFRNYHFEGGKFWILVLAIGLSFWVQYARTVRGVTLVERNKEYVEAARLIGLRPLKIMFQHILPNVLGPVLVIATINLALAVITEATLSFLGVGLPPTEPSLGTMIQIGNKYLFSGSWWMVAFPGPDAGPAGAGGEPAGRLAARCAQPEAALVSVRYCNGGGSHVLANDPEDRNAVHALVMVADAADARAIKWARSGDALTLDPHAQNEGPTHNLLHLDLRAADPARPHRQAAADARHLLADHGRTIRRSGSSSCARA